MKTSSGLVNRGASVKLVFPSARHVVRPTESTVTDAQIPLAMFTVSYCLPVSHLE